MNHENLALHVSTGQYVFRYVFHFVEASISCESTLESHILLRYSDYMHSLPARPNPRISALAVHLFTLSDRFTSYKFGLQPRDPRLLHESEVR
jgi:hypothetical protein